ncbi:MAG: hypothetical protein P9M06_03070 [Candidatus Saelkia tenebricola]|nr:hypothetical protein [Candidatus Saelkia tenebricola]
MLGVEDSGVWVPYVISIVTALFFMFYEILHWNEGDKHIHWFDEEEQVEE